MSFGVDFGVNTCSLKVRRNPLESLFMILFFPSFFFHPKGFWDEMRNSCKQILKDSVEYSCILQRFVLCQ